MGVILLLPYWFPLNNSETIKLVTLAFCSIQSRFIRDTRATFGIPYSPQYADIEQKSDGSISNFRISSQSLIIENCHNSRSSDDVDMKLGPVTKIDKTNKTASKKFKDDVMSRNCDITVIFQFLTNPETGFRTHSCRTYVFIYKNILS